MMDRRFSDWELKVTCLENHASLLKEKDMLLIYEEGSDENTVSLYFSMHI